MLIQNMKEKLKPKTALQAAYSTTGTSAALSGVIVWIYPWIQAGQPNMPAMTAEAAWGLSLLTMVVLNEVGRRIPMRMPQYRRVDDAESPPPTIHQDDEQ